MAINTDKAYIPPEKWELLVTGLMMFEQPLTLSYTYPSFNALASFPHPQRDKRGKGGEQRPPMPDIFYISEFPGPVE